MSLPFCVSCGEIRDGWYQEKRPEVTKLKKTHCAECAKEIALGEIGPRPDTVQDAGGGKRVIRETKTH